MAAAPDRQPTKDPLLEPGSTCWRLARAERVAFLVDGESFFPVLAAALERAQRQVLLLGWDFHGARVRLRRDGRRRRLPDEFQKLLAALLESRPELRVHARSLRPGSRSHSSPSCSRRWVSSPVSEE